MQAIPPRPSVPGAHVPRVPRHAAFGLSHRGLVRAANEDSYAVAPDAGFFAVAGGLGGGAAGEVVARRAVDAVLARVERTLALWPEGLGPSLFARAVTEAYAEVHAAAGTATTFTGLLLRTDRVVIAQAGSARAYRLRRGKLGQLTDGHKLVAACAPAAVTAPAGVDARQVGLEPGDTFLLATDGLHGVVQDAAIAAVLRGEPDLAKAAAQLVARANGSGGPDNVTVVLVRVV